MRNLAAHPLTADEAIRILQDASEEISTEERVGDMRPYTLRKLAQFVDNNREEFDQFVKDGWATSDEVCGSGDAAS